MAKNDPLGPISYLRKDTTFFSDGTWYISTPCLAHGLIDEEVPWAEAKTPHHAGVIADQRHSACALAADEVNQRAIALAEIKAAEGLLVQQEQNLERARQRLAALDPATVTTDAMREKTMVAAKTLVDRHERGLLEAQRRVADVRRENAG
jgi:hypothetical protein